MLRTLKEHRELNEEGFTLIELMVVVLIIAILLAIAIPTFLGAKGSANNRAAQSALRNALTAEKTYLTNNNSIYTDTTAAAPAGVTALNAIEPAIRWTSLAAAGVKSIGLTNPNQILATTSAVTNGAAALPNTAVMLESKSATGDCFYIFDETIVGATDVLGTSYFRDLKCSLTTGAPGVPAPPVAPAVLAVNTTVPNVWATSF